MILGLEIGMLIFGIIALSTGKMKLAANRIVTGMPARMLGIVLMLPIPIALAVGFAIGVMTAVRGGGQPNLEGMQTTIIVVELGVDLTCLIAALAIGFALAKPPRRRRRIITSVR